MKTKIDTGFAGRLKTLREARGLTQQQLADATGMNRFGIAKLEQGVSEPYWPTVLKIAAALDVDCREFQPAAKEKALGRPRRAAEAKGKK